MATGEPMVRRLVTARVWALLIPVRLSGDAAFRAIADVGELERRLILTIAERGAASPAALIAAAGQDKAQVSRALRGLGEAHLIVRPSLRGPITLSATGEKVAAEMMALGERRNAALVAGIAPDELGFLRTMVERLIARAIALFAEEKRHGEVEPLLPPLGARSATGLELLAPLLFTLLIYLQRSAALSYKRLVGLSSFDWQVLSQVVEHAPLPLARMVLMLGRDKSQAGRTVKRLEEGGLVERLREGGKRAVLLAPTARAREVYAVMEAEALRRNAFLVDDIAPADLSRFLAIVDRLTDNASRL